MPGTVSILVTYISTGAPGNGASPWGPRSVKLAPGSVGFKLSQAHTRLQTDATYNFEEGRTSQCSSAGSGKDEPCPLQHALLRARQRWETKRQLPANSCKTSQIPCEITGYILKISGRTEKLIATYQICLINVHFTSAKFYILLLSYVNWAAFCTMINRSLNKQILLLEITLSGAMLGGFFCLARGFFSNYLFLLQIIFSFLASEIILMLFKMVSPTKYAFYSSAFHSKSCLIFITIISHYERKTSFIAYNMNVSNLGLEEPWFQKEWDKKRILLIFS